jgi:signal transduction histidine kinase
MEVRFNYDYELKFTKQQDLALYRIFQELINNTLKHAAATKIQIDLETVENQINISYQDNGKGLTEEAAKQLSTGIGLKSIESRANLINAKMNIPIDQGQGFQFNLSLVR